MLLERLLFVVLQLLRVTLVVAFAFAAVRMEWSIMLATTATLVLTFLPYLLQQRYRIVLPTDFVFLIVLFIYATLFLGEVHDFYQRFWWWDALLHGGSALGFSFIGFIILYMLHKAGKLDCRPGLIGLFSFTFGVSIGALWEIFEFAVDQTLGFNMQKSGLRDTMWDIIINAIGSFVAAFLGYLYLKGQGNFIGRAAEAFLKKNKRLWRKRKREE